ncbi:MAG: glycosyltransferase family 2 protein [Alphaproteobacteria bacterium]
MTLTHGAGTGQATIRPPQTRPTLSIVICTFQRPDLLGTCLDTCLAQTGLEPGTLEIVVVDNCPGESARPLVEARRPASGDPILRYVTEPRTNLSHARNTGVAAASGHLLAFVDDDNIVPKGWARTVIDLMAARRADVMFGDVDPVFPDDADPDIVALLRPYFCRRIGADAGERVHPKADGNIHDARTCNVTLRKDLCFPADAPFWFDPVFGLAGGEDFDYFLRLVRRVKGLRVFTSAEALMEEYIPASRISPAFVISRSYRGSQAYALAKVRNSGNKALTRAVIAAKALLQVGYWEMSRLRHGLRGGDLPFAGEVKHSHAMGKLYGHHLVHKTSPYR